MNDPRLTALLDKVDRLEKQIQRLTTLSYRAEEAGGVRSYAYADLPSANHTGRMAFVTNGRKAGEGAGAGTGVLAVVAELAGTLQWVNSDDMTQAVQV